MRTRTSRPAKAGSIAAIDRGVAKRPVMLLVLGPHRSGTSLTARMLECLGAENSRSLLPAQPDNPKGFFEDADIYRFNEDTLLPKLGFKWRDIGLVDWTKLSNFERGRLGLEALAILRRNYPLHCPLSVLKEPRLNNLLPFWLSLLEHVGFDVKFVCVVRDPVSVSRSLAKRDGLSLTHGCMVYLSAWAGVLPAAQEREVALVDFDEIFRSPAACLSAVARKLRLPLTPDFDELVHAFTAMHLDPNLRHESVPADDVVLAPELLPIASELYRALLQAVKSQNIRKTARFSHHLEKLFQGIAPLLGALNHSGWSRETGSDERLALETLDNNHRSMVATLAEAESEIEQVRSELHKTSQELATVTARMVAEQEQSKALLDAREEDSAHLVKTVEELKRANLVLQTEKQSILDARNLLAKHLARLEAEQLEAVKLHDSTKQARDTLLADKEALSTEVRHLRKQLKAAYADLAHLATGLAQQREDLASAQMQRHEEALRFQEAQRGIFGRLAAKSWLRSSRQREAAKLIRDSGLFDEDYYLAQYPEAKLLRIDPVVHYLTTGYRELKNPSLNFNTAAYVAANPDVLCAVPAINPLIHYILHGQREGRPTG